MKPKDLVNKWLELFNIGNTEEIANLYYEGAVSHWLAN